MKKDYREIRKKVKELQKEYDYRGPLHFTDFSNLSSIFDEKCIFSRKFCSNQKVNFLDVANQEVIEHTKLDIKKCVRFYYKEKTMTLYRNEGIKKNGETPHIPIPVYLLFDDEILYQDYTRFSDGNAASNYTDFGTDFSFFDAMDWDIIFDRGPILLDEGPEKWEFKRKRQAELLSIEPISLTYLKKIIFRSKADYKRACTLFGECGLYRIDANMFNNQENYIKDYDLIIDTSNNQRSLTIKFNTNLPVSDHKGHEYRLSDLNDNSLLNNNIFPFPSGTEFYIRINNLPDTPLKFKLWFYGVLSIETIIQ